MLQHFEFKCISAQLKIVHIIWLLFVQPRFVISSPYAAVSLCFISIFYVRLCLLYSVFLELPFVILIFCL